MAIPAEPATMMADSSSVPWSITVSMDFHNSPFWAKNASKQPNITPLLNKWKAVKKLVKIPSR